jgi:sugar phosphate isomerase/epimerase
MLPPQVPGPPVNLDAALAPTLEAVGLPPRQALHRLADLEFRAVQVNALSAGFSPAELDRSACRDLLALLRRRELTLGGIDCFLDPGGFLDKARLDRTVAELRGAIALAGRLGRPPISLRLPAPCDAMVRAVAVAEADRWGVALADHDPAAGPTPGIGLGLDTAAWLAAELDPLVAVTSGAADLVSVRLVDLLRSGMRGPVGDPVDGRLDVVLLRAALHAVGFAGAVVIDARQWPRPLEGILQSRAAWARAAA